MATIVFVGSCDRSRPERSQSASSNSPAATPQTQSNQHGPLSAGRMTVISPTTPAEYTYTTRGEITGLPGSGSLYVQVHHEAIADFANRSGEVVGMKEMIMDMPNATPDVDIKALKMGDKVAMTFEVRYKSDPRMVITKFELLPAETVLNLSPIVEGR
jgi:hypothetical protein